MHSQTSFLQWEESRKRLRQRLKGVALARHLLPILGAAERICRRLVLAPSHRKLRQQPWTKLQLGAGQSRLEGWLNTDLVASRDVVYVDATRRFPFADGQFTYVFTEHMIEHVPFGQGCHMLSEIYRVLRTGGKVRIATPDFGFLLRLCREQISQQEQEYIAWAIRTLRPDLPAGPVSVVNNFFRDWGHQYIYDQQTLSQVLSNCGFGNIVRCEVGQSSEPALSGLERHGELIGDSNNRLETLVIEATKLD
jgi:predicted SAM-dependent methyltransferase